MKKLIFVLIIVTLIIVPIAIGSTPIAHACGIFTNCDNQNTDPNQTNNSFLKESLMTEGNQRVLDKNQPAPYLEKSNERQNLIKRLQRFNDPNKVSYIYLIEYGKVMAFYTIKGKVSALSSALTNPQQMIDRYGNQCNASNSQDCFVVDSPQQDGSYGTNGDGIFFFTTEDVYVEWHGDYMLADQPLQMATAPELVQQVK
jgi:hypothetical protein